MNIKDARCAAENFAKAGDSEKALEHCAITLRSPHISHGETTACINILISLEKFFDARILCNQALRDFPDDQTLKELLTLLPEQQETLNVPQAVQQRSFWSAGSLYEAKFHKICPSPGIHELSDKEKDAKFEKDTKAITDVISSDISLQARWRVLDFGCGIGRAIKQFRKIARIVDGVDISESMITLAREYLSDSQGDGNLMVNNGYDLRDISPSHYDFVYSVHVFEHIRSRANTAHLLREIKRVLKDGAYFWLQVHEDNHARADAYAEGLSFINYEFQGNGYSHEDLRELLETTGFIVRFIKGEKYWITALCQK